MNIQEKDAVIIAYFRNRFYITHDEDYPGEPYHVRDAETHVTHYVQPEDVDYKPPALQPEPD